jgi:hypothetical protein
MAYIWDGTKVAITYLGGPGAGETPGTDILNGWNLTSGWTIKETSLTVSDSNTFVTLKNTAYIEFNAGLTPGTLYKSQLLADGVPTATSLTDAGFQHILAYGDNIARYVTSRTDLSNLYLRNTAGTSTTVNITSMSMQPVTDCPATGLRCFSDITCDTRGWVSDTGIDLNAATHTVQIIQIDSPTGIFRGAFG